VLLLFIALSFLSCNQDGYRTFTAKNSFCNFSLDYPSAYSNKEGPTLDLFDKYFTVSFNYPDKAYKMVNPDPSSNNAKTVTVYHTPALIHVFINNKGFTAKTLIEEYLNRQSGWANFNLLERSIISISDVSAEYAHFVSSSLLPMRPESGEEIPLKHLRLVYFDYNELVWRIELEYEGEMAEQAQSDFEHILNTFKILD
jgi:hypothetical protein